MLSQKEQILAGQWLRSGNIGTSSIGLLSFAMGNTEKPIPTPSDPSDFYRCLNFIDTVIFEKGALLKQVAEFDSRWEKIVNNWQGMIDLYFEEEQTGKCPKLYEFMKKIGL